MNEQDFFRLAALRICGTLDFEIALKDTFDFIKTYIPGHTLNLNLYDRGLGTLRTVITVTEKHAKKTNIYFPLTREGKDFLNNPDLPLGRIINNPLFDTVAGPRCQQSPELHNTSMLILYMKIKGKRLGDVQIITEGCNGYTEEHLQLLIALNEPFSIALSNWLRFEEVVELKELLSTDVQYLQKKLNNTFNNEIIGGELGLKSTMDLVKEVASLDSPVMLQGETGAGKEIFASAIHSLSRRKTGPFIRVNCGAIPETLIDSELFGHEKGAFTGAISLKSGYFERANGGTIFLDEVAELPLHAQVRLLRVLQEKDIVRVGGTREIKVDIRIISATNQKLAGHG